MAKKIINIFLSIVFILLLFGCIRNTKQLNKYRRNLDTVRNELIRSEEYNRELTERFGSISANVQKLGELADRNVSGVRQCVEIIEETRVIVQELENLCYDNNTLDSYYDWLDSELGLQ